jgi:7,8-dihydropterin-6-yl-methyl-4-(beta-D-ribofuranosyl)aminobenzene 5'-phosphate synthase
LTDDQSLAIVGERGLILLLGCCHAGLINTIGAAKELTGVSEVRAVIGGTHLGFCSAGQLDLTVEALRDHGIAKIYGSHCTGFVASARLHREFPGRFQPAQVGTTIEA